jgi:drug/metabolite transporter (DMT)-like permease
MVGPYSHSQPGTPRKPDPQNSRQSIECLRAASASGIRSRSATSSASASTLFVYLAKGTLLNGMLLYNTGPLFTPPLAWLLWRTTIRPTGIASIVLGFVGVTLVIDPTRSTLDGMTLLGLASGFFNSCSQLSLYAGGKEDPALSETDNLFQFFTLCAAACLVVLLFRPAELTIGAQRLGESALLASFVALKSLSSHFWLPRTAVVCLRRERSSG